MSDFHAGIGELEVKTVGTMTIKPGRCTGFDKMSKVFHFWVNSTILKRISNSIQNFTGFGAFNTIKSQWSGGRVQVQVQVFSLSL